MKSPEFENPDNAKGEFASDSESERGRKERWPKWGRP
jgi:hypothetical protein